VTDSNKIQTKGSWIVYRENARKEENVENVFVSHQTQDKQLESKNEVSEGSISTKKMKGIVECFHFISICK